jgi:hypothetical protein
LNARSEKRKLADPSWRRDDIFQKADLFADSFDGTAVLDEVRDKRRPEPTKARHRQR